MSIGLGAFGLYPLPVGFRPSSEASNESLGADARRHLGDGHLVKRPKLDGERIRSGMVNYFCEVHPNM